MTDTVTLLRAIATECKRRGLAVTSVPGWETRGLGPLEPTHCHAHHVAAERDVTALLLQGRPGIRGPLCNLELRKDGTVVLIAARRANHAGVGTVPSSRSIGIEATGPIPITAQGARAYPQYTAYVKLCAAIRKVTGWPADRVVGHKETATPPGRKVDPVFDMDAFRAAVSSELLQPNPSPPGDDMFNDPDRALLKDLQSRLANLVDPKAERSLRKRLDDIERAELARWEADKAWKARVEQHLGLGQ